jgi:tRNA A37 methylthiotransferase MiaB
MPVAQVIATSCSRRGLELEQVKNYLQGNGYTLSKEDWKVDPRADLVLLSTCGFTQAAEDFGFQTLRRIQKTKAPATKLVVCGCIPPINPERLRENFEGPSFDPRSYEKLDEIVDPSRRFCEFARPNTYPEVPRTRSLRHDVRKLQELLTSYDGSFAGLTYISRTVSNGLKNRLIHAQANIRNHRTFYIQIQEGCSMKCSYCSIRKAIGGLSSKPVAQVMTEFERGLAAGYTSFQLAGDNAGSYGLDIGMSLARLLDEFVKVDRDFHLDLTDIAPPYLHLFFDQVVQLGKQGRLSQLYIPIQSASERVLRLMRRQCDMARVKDMLIAIRDGQPQLVLGTSVMVGFPSETIEELDATIAFCRDVRFNWVWCHSFSARPETEAAHMEGVHSADEILRRSTEFKSALQRKALVTTAADNKGSRTCQG